MSCLWPCPIPLPDGFGLSPTWHICGCTCSPCESGSCCRQGACAATCGAVDFKLDCEGKLSTSNQVRSAVLWSIAMRARLPDDSPLEGPCLDRGGWWANEMIGHEPGTLNWTLEFQRPNRQTANQAAGNIDAALLYLEDAGVIDDVDVNAEVDLCTGLICIETLKITPRLEEPNKSHWSWMWDTECEVCCG